MEASGYGEGAARAFAGLLDARKRDAAAPVSKRSELADVRRRLRDRAPRADAGVDSVEPARPPPRAPPPPRRARGAAARAARARRRRRRRAARAAAAAAAAGGAAAAAAVAAWSEDSFTSLMSLMALGKRPWTEWPRTWPWRPSFDPIDRSIDRSNRSIR